jgi:hypothetical protein
LPSLHTLIRTGGTASFSSPKIVSHSNDTILGFKPPFDIPTCLFSLQFPNLSVTFTLIIFVFLGATLVILSSQLTIIFNFFLSHNLRIARKQAWDLVITSRGKGPAFWQPYIEEWDLPPRVNVNQWAGLGEVKGKILRFAFKHGRLANGL